MGPMPTSSTFKLARPSGGDARGVAGAVHADAYGVKLRLDLTVAHECDSNHKQHCANNPQPE